VTELGIQATWNATYDNLVFSPVSIISLGIPVTLYSSALRSNQRRLVEQHQLHTFLETRTVHSSSNPVNRELVYYQAFEVLKVVP
jgi:hypothetical protein